MPNASLSIDGTEVIKKENGLTSIDIGTIVSQSGFIQTCREGTLGQGGKVFLFKDTSNISWIVHEFRDDGIFWLPSTKSCDIFMIGGGGSGGPSHGNQDTGKGGGGAGGALWRQSYSLGADEYDIIVGKGGWGSTHGYNDSDTTGQLNGNNGEDTYAFGVIAKGGGHGGGSDERSPRQEGGCGGGGGARNTTSGVSASWNNGASSNQPTFTDWTSYGNSGGNTEGDANYSGGGGGGIGSVGGNGSGGASSATSEGGTGGQGLDFSSYFGTSVGHFGWFGGGGGGGTYRHSTDGMYQAPPNGGVSYYGGGGYGVSAREGSQSEPNTFAATRINGMNGTGGGGGGASENHENYYIGGAQNGKGGSGIVLIRYQL